MKKKTGKELIGGLMSSALILIGGVFVTGCTDNNYDLDDIDMTVGFGNGELNIPTSSTTTIKLSEVLDLEENGDVKEDIDGTYRFYKKGDAVSPTKTRISSEEGKCGIIRRCARPVEFCCTIGKEGCTPHYISGSINKFQ